MTDSMRDRGSFSSLLEHTYLAPLRELQNKDGGWGFNARGESRIEPTAWALLALQEFSSAVDVNGSLERGFRFLIGAQLEDGSWAAMAGQREGCWVTSLACWALLAYKQYPKNLMNGLLWLNKDRPRDSAFWWRLARRLTIRKRINSQNISFSGWCWTPHTASWVEPTCYALIVQRAPMAAPMTNSRTRRELAEAMLYDRMCPQGGWNCGNPMVYGVAGQPQVGPTVWALIALREYPEHPKNRKSLDWLESNQETVRSPESLALTYIGLSVYGRCNTALRDRVAHFQESAALPWGIQALSWMALALSETGQWLNVRTDSNS
jgi:hypothetical protein